jgi:hypothetical protein
MPPRKTHYKKKAHAHKPRKARAPRRRGGIPHLPGTLAPQHMITQLKFVSNFQKLMPAGGAVTSFNQYRLNSVWDPDYTNTLGTSCLGLAQWEKIYQRYRVYKLDYHVRLTNLTPDTVITGALVPANYVDSTFSVSDFMRPLARRFELGNNQGQNRSAIKGSIYLPKLMGVTGAQYKADGTTESGWRANPTQPLLMNIVLQSTNVAGQIAVGCQVEFTYHVEMMGIEASSEAIDVSTGLALVPVATYAIGDVAH